jgi:hypothetical protein
MRFSLKHMLVGLSLICVWFGAASLLHSWLVYWRPDANPWLLWVGSFDLPACAAYWLLQTVVVTLELSDAYRKSGYSRRVRRLWRRHANYLLSLRDR